MPKRATAQWVQCIICSRSFVPEKLIKRRLRPTEIRGEIRFIVEKCLGGTWNSTSRTPLPCRVGVYEQALCPTHQEIIAEGRRLQNRLASLEKILEPLKRGVRSAVLKSLDGEESLLMQQQEEPIKSDDKSYWKFRRMFHEALTETDANSDMVREERVLSPDACQMLKVEIEEDIRLPQVEILGLPTMTEMESDLKNCTQEILQIEEVCMEVKSPGVQEEEVEVDLKGILNYSVLEGMDDCNPLVDPLLDSISRHNNLEPVYSHQPRDPLEFEGNCNAPFVSPKEVVRQNMVSSENAVTYNQKCEIFGTTDSIQSKSEAKKRKRTGKDEISNDAISTAKKRATEMTTGISEIKVDHDQKLFDETPKVVSVPLQPPFLRQRLQLQCPYCIKLCESTEEKRKHIETDHAENNFCKICDKRFEDSQALKRHNDRYHQTENPAQCDLCNKTYPSVTLMKDHRRRHCENKTLTQCDQCHGWYKHLKRHIQNMHGENFREKNPRPAVDRTCRICHKTYQTLNAFRHHTNEEHLNLRPCVLCHICGKQLADKQSLKNHITSQHVNALPRQ